MKVPSVHRLQLYSMQIIFLYQDLLNQICEGVPLALMKRVKSNKKSAKGHVYTLELKSFALTLQLYSARHILLLEKHSSLHYQVNGITSI